MEKQSPGAGRKEKAALQAQQSSDQGEFPILHPVTQRIFRGETLGEATVHTAEATDSPG